MSQAVGIELVLIGWALFGGYVYWDLWRVRNRARKDLDQLLEQLSDRSERQRDDQIRKHLDAQYSDYRSYRELPLWRRWTESMGRPGNLVFGVLLGVAMVTTVAWMQAESWRDWLRWCAAIIAAVASLAVVARVVRRVF